MTDTVRRAERVWGAPLSRWQVFLTLRLLGMRLGPAATMALRWKKSGPAPGAYGALAPRRGDDGSSVSRGANEGGEGGMLNRADKQAVLWLLSRVAEWATAEIAAGAPEDYRLEVLLRYPAQLPGTVRNAFDAPAVEVLDIALRAMEALAPGAE